MAKLHRQRVEREKALFREPGTFDAIVDHIGNTGTLMAWCKMHDIRYTATYSWIAADEQRAARYEIALASRKAALSDVFLEDVMRIRGGDLRKAFDKDGKALPIHKLPDDLALIMKEFDSTTAGEGDKSLTTTSAKLVGQEKGVELLGRHLGELTNRTELTGKGGGPLEFKDLTRNVSKLSDAQLAQLQDIFKALGLQVPA